MAFRPEAGDRSLVLHELDEDTAVDHDLVARMQAVGDVELIAGAFTQGD
jgi:hypothetical protein